jgi:glyoxylase-like metal-dependent hydrolase (beta-lactamase superfamily II)/8-oxo-dGTP pyrophosphatase MutT (NUDIX family)
MPSFPDFWSFPGGGVTRFDRVAAEDLPQFDNDDEGAALVALLREIVEEVGWAPSGRGLVLVDEPTRAAVLEDGKTWHPLVADGDIPANPVGFKVISFRTTPPLTPLRFANRFFHLHDSKPPEPSLPSTRSEFDELRWMQPADALAAWTEGAMRIPPPQITLLRDLISALEDSADDSDGENSESGGDIGLAVAALAASPPTGEHRIEFAPGVECVPLPTDTLPPATTTNCYILGEPGGELLVVDPAARDSTGLAYLERRIRAAEAKGSRVIATIFTHRHPDHIGDLSAISEIYQAPIWATAETHKVIPPCDTDRVLSDGDSLAISGPSGKVVWQVLETPGHCPGHICLAGEVGVISGDLAVMVGTILVPSNDGDMDAYLASLERVRDLDAPLLLPAHGPLSPVPEKLLNRYLSHRRARHARVLEAVKSGLNDVESIADFAYADTPDAHPILKVDQTISHLNAHERAGAVEQNDGKWLLQG